MPDSIYPTWTYGEATLASMTTILMDYNTFGIGLFMKEVIGLTDEQIDRGARLIDERRRARHACRLAQPTPRSCTAARFPTSVGIGVGFSLVVAPVYNAEISPTPSRNILSSLLDIRTDASLAVYPVSNTLCS
uniref:Uncharacterized protein n=1 Tax=Leersia perrieri TaxID=77586 RepID=A0A0D9XUJ6_9ORYZ